MCLPSDQIILLTSDSLRSSDSFYSPLTNSGRKEASVEVLGALGPVGVIGASAAFLELGLPWLALSALGTLTGMPTATHDLLHKARVEDAHSEVWTFLNKYPNQPIS